MNPTVKKVLWLIGSCFWVSIIVRLIVASSQIEIVWLQIGAEVTFFLIGSMAYQAMFSKFNGLFGED